MKFFQSVSRWESSFFGGYDRVVIDHPPITVPKNIITKLPKKSDISIPFYVRQKLIDMFLLKINKSSEAKFVFTHNGEVVENEEGRFFVINKTGIGNAMNIICNSDKEISNLFWYYEDFINDTQFMFKIAEPKSGENKIGDDGKLDDEKSEEKKNDDKKSKPDNKRNTNEDKSKEQKSSGGEPKELSAKELNDIANEIKSELEKIKSGKSEFDWNAKTVSNTKLKKETKFVVVDKEKKKCVYSKKQIQDAQKLSNLLDINFDPKEDKISNLKLGKIDINKIAEIPSGNTHVYYQVEENQSTKPFSVCILCDESGSMRGGYDDVQHEIVKVLYKTFSTILPQDKIYVYGHSGESSPEIRIYNDKYNCDFEYTIGNQLDMNYNENYDGPVIESIYEKIRSHTDDNIIFISISDGQPAGRNYGGRNAIDDLKRVIEKCKRDGFVTVGIGLDLGLVKEIYQYHVVIEDVNYSAIKSISGLINRVVKSEFQT